MAPADDYGAVSKTQWRRGLTALKKGPAPFGIRQAVGLAVIPWVVFLGSCLLFATVYHVLPVIPISFFAIGLGALVFQGIRGWSSKNTWLTSVSALSIMALCISSVLGLVVNEMYIGPYLHYDRSPDFTNVLASDSAAGMADAGKLVFADDVALDSVRALGYKEDGTVYCVVPIIDTETSGPSVAPNVNQVQFWAVGTNCCGARGAFNCDDTFNVKARSGLVLPDSMFHDSRAKFLLAVKQAEAAFNIISAKEPLFVRWLLNPEQAQANMRIAGACTVLIACVVYLVLSIIVASTLQLSMKPRY